MVQIGLNPNDTWDDLFKEIMALGPKVFTVHRCQPPSYHIEPCLTPGIVDCIPIYNSSVLLNRHKDAI